MATITTITTKIRNAMVYQEGARFLRGDISIDGDGRFAAVPGDVDAREDVGGAGDGGGVAGDSGDAGDGGAIDASGWYAIPGLVDLHFHGCAGSDFSSAGLEDMKKMARYEARHGVTALCPATMTIPQADIEAACARLAALAKAGPGAGEASIVGVHLEGPFLSCAKLGAQNPAYLVAPDVALFRRFNEAASGLVRLVSVAPETEGALAFIGALKDEVRVSVAHTGADYALARRAFAAGAKHVTHLYNAMTPLAHRAPGMIGAVSDSPGVTAEIICDGVHIHPAAVRAAFRLMGAERMVFVSDSMMATGLDDGDYELGGLAVTVRGKEARLRDGGNNIAGSVTNLMGCVRAAVTEMQIPLADAVRCASETPARALGLLGERGLIRKGAAADFCLVNADLSRVRVFLRGEELPA